MANPTKSGRQYLHGVNLLRGLLALTVLVWHYQHLWTGPSEFNYTTQPFFELLRIPYTRGYDAVPLFWMVSGLVLAHAYPPLTVSRNSVLKFGLARFARLYPLHLTTLIVVTILHLLGDGARIYGNSDFKHFLLNVLFISSWGFEDGYSFNGPVWSVSVELPIYLGFAIGFLKSTKALRCMLCISLLSLLSLASRFRENLEPFIPINWSFLRCALFFLGGLLVYSALESLSPSRLYAVFGIASVCLALLALNRGNWLWGTGACLCALTFAAQGDLPDRMLAPVRIVGDLTYSVFLWHIPVQMTMRWVITQLGFNEKLFGSAWLLVAYLLATYFIGYLSYVRLEEPARRSITYFAASRFNRQSK